MEQKQKPLGQTLGVMESGLTIASHLCFTATELPQKSLPSALQVHAFRDAALLLTELMQAAVGGTVMDQLVVSFQDLTSQLHSR